MSVVHPSLLGVGLAFCVVQFEPLGFVGRQGGRCFCLSCGAGWVPVVTGHPDLSHANGRYHLVCGVGLGSGLRLVQLEHCWLLW